MSREERGREGAEKPSPSAPPRSAVLGHAAEPAVKWQHKSSERGSSHRDHERRFKGIDAVLWPGTPDGTLAKSTRIMSRLHLIKSPQKAFVKGRLFKKKKNVDGRTFCLSHSFKSR